MWEHKGSGRIHADALPWGRKGLSRVQTALPHTKYQETAKGLFPQHLLAGKYPQRWKNRGKLSTYRLSKRQEGG